MQEWLPTIAERTTCRADPHNHAGVHGSDHSSDYNRASYHHASCKGADSVGVGEPDTSSHCNWSTTNFTTWIEFLEIECLIPRCWCMACTYWKNIGSWFRLGKHGHFHCYTRHLNHLDLEVYMVYNLPKAHMLNRLDLGLLLHGYLVVKGLGSW